MRDLAKPGLRCEDCIDIETPGRKQERADPDRARYNNRDRLRDQIKIAPVSAVKAQHKKQEGRRKENRLFCGLLFFDK
ncbi:hypothetical protein RRG08_022152 [Elysia crispata]|uniref:Uncharacterized protein n=1 Tax=Elysia crispata TaxID=231223 RepID=A0AAE1DYP2_9GAST|nr:hypothetical protein RRG08_022152 [Elysia crispata]